METRRLDPAFEGEHRADFRSSEEDVDNFDFIGNVFYGSLAQPSRV